MGVLLGVIILILVIGFFGASALSSRQQRPRKGESFVCANCGSQARHDTRTLRGWEAGVRRVLCWNCFLAMKKAQQLQDSKTSPAGCAGVVAMFLLAPLIVFGAWRVIVG